MSEIRADLEGITRALWETLFELPLNVAPTAPLGSDGVVTACVHIVGEWRGAVMLQCGMPLARTLAAQMFQAESAPTLEDVRDALGELTNVIGGNVKALFPGPSRISLPAVAVGSDYQLGVVESSPVTAVPFECAGQPLLITLFEDSTDGEGPDR
jgi:chemotaxis protein CheX